MRTSVKEDRYEANTPDAAPSRIAAAVGRSRPSFYRPFSRGYAIVRSANASHRVAPLKHREVKRIVCRVKHSRSLSPPIHRPLLRSRTGKRHRRRFEPTESLKIVHFRQFSLVRCSRWKEWRKRERLREKRGGPLKGGHDPGVFESILTVGKLSGRFWARYTRARFVN